MTSTYEKIATNTLGSATASVTFSSIAGTYTDLVVAINGATTADTSAFVRFNSDTGSNYSYTEMNGNGTSAASSRGSNQSETFFGNPRTSYSFQANLSINNYSNSTTYKTFLSRSGNSTGWTFAVVGLWRNTAAITSVTFLASGTTWVSGSTFTLYGIKAE